MFPYRDVKVWEKAHLLCLHLHELTAGFPAGEQNGLALQIRRAAVYLPCKITEGCMRGNDKEAIRSLESARTYASELEYFLLLARDLGHLAGEPGDLASAHLTEVQKMLYGFIRFLKERADGTVKPEPIHAA